MHTVLPRLLLKLALAAVSAAAFLASPARAADWPQYRGADHDGTTAEVVSRKWPAGGPKVLWKAPVGPGLGSFVVAGKGAYLFVEKNHKESCVRLDADTGKELWSTEIDRTSNDSDGNGGKMPRSTPAADGDKVYVLSSFLKLACLNAADGKVAWQHDLMGEYGGRNIAWDNAASPAIDGDKVFVAGGGPGQSLLAFNKATGELAWKAADEKMTHASPTVATIHGVRQVIFYTQSGLVAAKADDGEVLWRFPVKFNVSTASNPIVGGKDGDLVYCSAGYGTGTAVCAVVKKGDKFDATEKWRVPDKNENVNHWTTPVYKDGYLYGIFGFKRWGADKKQGPAPLKCIDLLTGKEMWSKPGFGSGGGTVLAGDTLVVQSDTGAIVLVEATPKAYKPLAQAQALHPQPPYDTNAKERCWTMAIVAGGRIYARSTTEAVCLDVSK